MPISLVETQRLFWRAITWPSGVADFLAQASESDRQAFEETFAESDAFPRVERVEVYAEAYFWRLFRVLSEGFPAVVWALGATTFHNLVTDYVLERPSVHPNLQQLGERFPSFLAEGEAGRARPWVVGLGQLEWTRDALLTATDEPVLSATELQSVPPDAFATLRFTPVRAMRILSGVYDAAGLWLAFDSGDPPPEQLDGRRGVFHALVWRNGLPVYHRKLSAGESTALRSMCQGAPFEQIANAAEEPAEAAAWLARWLQDGLIARIERE